jgi:hypothetical protein
MVATHSLLTEVARRLLKAPPADAGSARRIPLSTVRGIAGGVEERLAEEGIQDVATMALADPLNLMRVTAFDKRQILGWIDEALLIVCLPRHWQSLEEAGMTGAIDLAWCVTTPGVDMAKLGATVGLDGGILEAAARRLSEDMQVVIVWALYQTVSEGDPDDEKPPAV